MAVLDAVTGLPEKSLLILRDFHAFFAEPNPLLFRKLKDALLHAKTANKTLILLGSELKLPPEVEKLIAVVELALPSRDELRAVLTNLCAQNEREVPAAVDAILDALGGMTTHDAEDALSLSIIEAGEIDPAILSREKANVVKKNGLLEIVESNIRPESIGGLDVLKEDLLSKRDIFTQEARDYGLPSPRGILTVGQPGTGKSLTAQCTGSIFNVPLLRLEAGKLFGSLVGESERNWRNAFATARAIAPCILWVDEVRGRDPKKFHLPGLAKLTDGYSGRQIEQVWIKTLAISFNDGRREPGMDDIAEALKKFVPTSVTMSDVIEARRKRLANRATPASRPEKIATLKANGRKLAA